MTKGIRTSEFWVGLIGAILVFLAKYFDWNIDTAQIIGFISVIITYIWSRTTIKAK